MENLHELHDELKNEQQYLEDRLNEIQEELASVKQVLRLIEKIKGKKDERKASLLPNKDINEYAEMTFKEAFLKHLEKHPEKKWVPKEVTKALPDRGFKTKSKNFGNIVRAMLLKFRNEGIVNAEKIKVGKLETWRYWHKSSVVEHRFPGD